MTIYRVIAVRDRAADVFGQPVIVANLGSAIRSFGDEVNNEKSAFFGHPDDYDLWEIGSYDDESGTLVSRDKKQIAIGKEMKIAANGKG
ncbi:MAG: nonstructural protein [Microvirus sp.]|nr:MAG: nonstructural protein [Microvirus sp.]